MKRRQPFREDDMVETRHIESWVGQEVSLEFYGGGERDEASTGAPLVVRRNRFTLKEVDDQGVLVEPSRGGKIFYGWNAIISLRLAPS
jgi:hypothetical protein